MDSRYGACPVDPAHLPGTPPLLWELWKRVMVYEHVGGGVRKRVFTQAERPGKINLRRLKDQGGEFMDTEGSGEVIYAG